MKKRTLIWIIVPLVSLSLAFALARLFLSAGRLSYGICLLLGVVIALLAVKAFSKGDRKEVDSLKKQIRDLDRELAEKNSSRLNVIGLNPILHVAVLNVDTSFVRPYVREEGGLTFNGALRADLQVEYGIRLEDVLFRYDESEGRLTLANFHPGIISYSRKQFKWEFARSWRTRKLLGIAMPDISDRDAELFTGRMCENLRAELEKEIDSRKVEEFEWLSPLVTDQVVDVLRLMVGKENLEVSIAPGAGDGFLPLQEFRQRLSLPPSDSQ